MTRIVNVLIMEKTMNNENFLKNHADTLAVIGVNIAIAAILLTICISNISSISASNTRMDSANARMDLMQNLIIQEMKAFHEESKDFHGRLCAIEERNKK